MPTSCRHYWPTKSVSSAQARYIPERNDIVLVDFEPTRGKEIGKYRPALVLSSHAYQQQSGLMICCPISTSIRGAPTEVPVTNLEAHSVVACNLIHTFDWRVRKAKKVAQGAPPLMDEVLMRLLPLMGAEHLLKA